MRAGGETSHRVHTFVILSAPADASIVAVEAVPDDAELLRRACDGDLAALTALIERTEGRLRAVLTRLLDDPRDAEEALQDTFVQAWRGCDGFRGGSAVTTWLHRIAVNTALMRTRSRRLPTTPLDPAVPHDGPEVHESAERGELSRFLAGRLRALEPEQRVPLVLRDLAGLSNQEIADALGISLPAAKSRIHRARLWLMDEVAAWDGGDGDMG